MGPFVIISINDWPFAGVKTESNLAASSCYNLVIVNLTPVRHVGGHDDPREREEPPQPLLPGDAARQSKEAAAQRSEEHEKRHEEVQEQVLEAGRGGRG